MQVNRQTYVGGNDDPLDNGDVTLGQRIDERRKLVGISQAELARRVGVSQSTMNSLINGESRSSRSIVKIAFELRTSPSYLTGEIDDPAENAPPPAPQPIFQHLLMPVALPGEDALAQMFEGLLESVEPDLAQDALARELAQLLPTALSQLRGRLIGMPPAPAPAASAEALSTAAAGRTR